MASRFNGDLPILTAFQCLLLFIFVPFSYLVNKLSLVTEMHYLIEYAQYGIHSFFIVQGCN